MKAIDITLKSTLSICVVFGLVSQLHAQSKPFQAIDIGAVSDVGGLSNDTPVKAVGQKNGHAFVFSEGQTAAHLMEFVPGDPFNGAKATAISPDGSEAVGVDADHPTDWPNPIGPSNPGHFPTPQSCNSGLGEPAALNDGRIAVGSCTAFLDGGDFFRPVRYSAATGALTVTELPAGFFGGKANGINNAGIIVGQSTTAQAASLAAIWLNPNQAPITLALPGTPEARGISNGSVLANNPDLVTMVGQFPDPIGVPRQRGWTFVLLNGALQLFTTTKIPFTPVYVPQNLPSYYQFLLQPFNAVETRRINRFGTSVGFAKNVNGSTRASLWNLGGSPADLTFNTSGLPAGMVLTDAVDVNDQGYVLAKGLVNGVLHGFMLKPTGAAIAFSAGY